MKLVSVVVPVFNAEEYLDKCIGSILNQTYKELEIIIVDDGSTDASGSICDLYQKKDSRVKVIHQKNGGLSNARNRGLAEARGEYIYFIDADDWLENICIERLAELIEGKDIAWCNCKYEYKNEEVFHESGNEHINEVVGFYNLIKYFIGFPDIREKTWMNVMVWNKLFRGDIIRNNKLLFDENAYYIEDMIFVYNYICKCGCGAATDMICYHYRQIDNSIMGGYRNTFKEKSLQMPLYYEKVYLDLEKRIGYNKNDVLLAFFRGRVAYYFHSVLWKLEKAKYQNQEFVKKSRTWIRRNLWYFWTEPQIELKVKISSTCCVLFYPAWRVIIRNYMK